LNPNTPFRTVTDEDGAAVLDTSAGTITTLNPAGAFVWQGLQAGESTVRIAENLARETGEPIEVVRADVEAFVRELQDFSLQPL
jgi:hypothetical protein